MHETRKLEEARYFQTHLAATRLERDHFLFELSAFLTAARSVLQYALLEAKSKPGGQPWYDNAMKKSQILSFFKDARDLNIHEKPAEVRAHVALTITDTVHVSDSIEVVVRDAQGNLIAHDKTEPVPPPESSTRSETEIHYFFADWSGQQDVEKLCATYLQELTAFVVDGSQKGFVSG